MQTLNSLSTNNHNATMFKLKINKDKVPPKTTKTNVQTKQKNQCLTFKWKVAPQWLQRNKCNNFW